MEEKKTIILIGCGKNALTGMPPNSDFEKANLTCLLSYNFTSWPIARRTGEPFQKHIVDEIHSGSEIFTFGNPQVDLYDPKNPADTPGEETCTDIVMQLIVNKAIEGWNYIVEVESEIRYNITYYDAGTLLGTNNSFIKKEYEQVFLTNGAGLLPLNLDYGTHLTVKMKLCPCGC